MTRRKWPQILGIAALLLPAASGAVPIRVTDGLVGEWHLQTTRVLSLELAPDTSGYGRTGRVYGGTGSSYGWMYTAVNLTGDKYVQVANSSNLNFGTGSFTLAAWIKMSNTSRSIKTIIDNRGSDGRGYAFAVYGGHQLLLQMADETGWVNLLSEPNWLSPNRWHHVAVSVARTTWPVNVTFYVDGYRAGIVTPKMGTINNTDLPFLIGGHKDSASSRFSDRIDEVLVYNRSLPIWEIWNIMNPGRPLYEPSYWNSGSRQLNNNCYNYANNKPTDTFAQPGRAAGAQWTSLTCAAVHQAAVADGLQPISGYPSYVLDLKTGVALVVAPGVDYHWYRLDDSGTWTHKPGSTPATNLDNSGNVITDPRTANRGIYTEFCGFYTLWSDITQGWGHEQVN